MQELPVSDRIMSILLNDYSNPFSESFNLKKIAEEFGEEVTDKEEEILKFIAICNQHNVHVKKNIIDAFTQLNLTKIETIDFLHRAINKHFIEIKHKVLSQYIDKNEDSSIGNIEFSKFKQKMEVK
ncbi:hypothetical protein [Formosa algae]|uniref:hypothetical protein n=1 Tax=Formosa algae TaxID=225843 RepID=UPI000CCEEF9E|nr:hypothetical protein [Formosa algae]PNW27871.1 hypothetical protein BKP44_10585 [Formosa algae]